MRTGLSPYHGEALVGRDLDVVVSTEELADVDNITRRKLLSEKFIVVTPKGYLDTVRTTKDLRRLADQLPLVRFNRQSHLGAQIERFLRRIDARIPLRLEVDTADTLATLVAADLGWGITTPLCLLQAGASAKRMKIHFINAVNSGRSLYVLARQDEYSRLFERTYAIAHSMLSESLMSRLGAIHPGLVALVAIEAEGETS